MAFAMDRKVRATVPLASRLTTIPNPMDWALKRRGKISEVNTHKMGPNPIEKNATYEQMAKMAKTGTNPCPLVVSGTGMSAVGVTCKKRKPTARVSKEKVIPIALVSNKGLLPMLSNQTVATRMKSVFDNPTATVARRTPDLPVMPACWNTTGL